MTTQATKKKILQAARKLFSQNGFAGTSMGNIAKLANVNHSLLFHHFGNKENLWLAAKQDIVSDAKRKQVILPDTDLPFSEFLQLLFKQNYGFYKNNPDIIRMLNWQRMETKQSKNIGVTKSQDMQAWINAFKIYQDKGDIGNKHKPEFIVTMILSIISSAALDPNVFIKTEDDLSHYFNFCIKQILK